jgi:WD40 repeat protein
MEGHLNTVIRLAWTPDGKSIASAATDGTIRVWSLTPNADVSYELYSDKRAEFLAVAAAPNGKRVAAGAKDGTIYIWTPTDGNSNEVISPDSISKVYSLVWSNNGTLAGIHENGSISFVAGNAHRSMDLHSIGPGSRIAWLDDDNNLAIALRNGQIALINCNRSADEHPKFLDPGIPGHSVSGIAVQQPNRALFAGLTDGTVIDWNLVTGKWQPMRETRSDRVKSVGARSLSVSPDGRWLATSGADRFVPVYNTEEHVNWLNLETESSETITVTFSPSGRNLAALGADNRIYVWNFANQPVSRLLTFSLDHAKISGSPSGGGGSLAWISDERLAVVAGSSAVVVVKLNPTGWHQRAVQTAPRQLPE